MDSDQDLAPPWARFPDYTRLTIGWRMGVGEDWWWKWSEWIETLPGREARLAYFKRHPKAPRTWAGLIHSILEPEASAFDCDRDQVQSYVDAGLVGDDVAFDSWLAALGGVVPAPWRDDSPAEAARYQPRGLSFWARWAAQQRRDDENGAWVMQWGKIPGPWQTFCVAAATGRLGVDMRNTWMSERLGVRLRWPELSEGLEKVAVDMAAGSGAPPTPWSLGVAPESFAQSYDMDMGYADAWMLWASESLDDLATWRAYNRYRGEVPSEWRALLQTELVGALL